MTLSVSEIEKLAEQAFQSGRWRRVAKTLDLLPPVELTAKHWLLLGASRHRTGELRAALDAFQTAIRLEPYLPQPYLAAATLCMALGAPADALEHCQAALTLAPDDPQALTNAGIALEALGNRAEALVQYEQALQCQADWPDALANRGVLLLQSGQFQSALANNRHFAEAHPHLPHAWFNLGEVCMACGLFEEAASAYFQARQLSPNHGRAWLQEAYALCRLERFAIAQPLLDEAWRRFPDLVRSDRQNVFPKITARDAPLDARALFVCFHFENLKCCEWGEHAYFLQRFADILADHKCPSEISLGFMALATGIQPELQLRLARQIATGISKSPELPHSTLKQASLKPLRIAYLSQDFRNHAVSVLLRKLFALHDRNRFRVFAYAIGPASDDPFRQEIENSVDRFVDLAAFDDTTAAQRIANDDIDILIDLSFYSDFARPGILAQRPAPIQIAWLAYLATTGAPWMDYVFLDPVVAPPEMGANFSEAIIRLPDSLFFCSYANEQPDAVSRDEAGLPENTIVLAAFHNGFKIDPTVFSIWMRLLIAHPQALLWLLAGTPEMESNLKREATARGVDPARLCFAPRIAHQHHLARLAQADLFLDSVICNGHTTVCDALAAGVPIVTCMGQSVAQRMAASLLYSAGMADLVAASLFDYERLALELLSDPELLRTKRMQLQQARKRTSFFQLEPHVRQLESGLLLAWERYRLGLPPTAIRITD